jgi:transposase InsO family protein
VNDQKVAFMAAWLRNEEPRTVLCERAGISRQTAYKLARRFEAEGVAGLEERSRAPLHHGRAMPAEVAVKLIEMRRAKPFWGPKKLLAILREREPTLAWPSSSTVSELLKREGLSEPRRRRRRPLPLEAPFGSVTAPNDSWSIDFKGWIRTGDGQRCDPLTVSDAFSRMLLALQIVSPTTEAVEAQMDELFRRFGLPRAIRSDNGPPFASQSAGGLTRLSARWAKMGIRLERIEPGQPQQNGRHERMHGSLKAETCLTPAADPTAQQARFDEWRREYNEERPHEGVGLVTPHSLYRPSQRPFPERLDPPAYDSDEVVRQVRTSGEIKWRGGMIFVSEVLVGEPIGIRQRSDGHWLVRFADVPLLLIDRASGKPARFGPGRPPRSKAIHQPSPDLSAM